MLKSNSIEPLAGILRNTIRIPASIPFAGIPPEHRAGLRPSTGEKRLPFPPKRVRIVPVF